MFPRLLKKGPQASVVQKLVNKADENQQNQLSYPVDCTILTSNNWDQSCKLLPNDIFLGSLRSYDGYCNQNATLK